MPTMAATKRPSAALGFFPVPPPLRLLLLCVGVGLALLSLWQARRWVLGPDRFVPWVIASPESVGLNSHELEELRAGLAQRNTHALLIVRHGQLAYEWYAEGYGPTTRQPTSSMAKSLAGGMALLVALHDARIHLDEPAARYIPAWREDPVRSGITIRQLAMHSSGMEDADVPGLAHDELAGWRGDFWREEINPYPAALTAARILFEPGTAYSYSSPGFAALGYAITASLQGGPEEDIRTLLNQRIMSPLGIPPAAWTIGYQQTYRMDGLDLHPIWGGGGYTPRAMARVGELMLRKGRWGGHALIDARWVDAVVSAARSPPLELDEDDPRPVPGLCWRTNAAGSWSAVPRDAFVASGAGHRVLLVVPSLDLVALRLGHRLTSAEESMTSWKAIETFFLDPLMQAVPATPYPPSAHIAGVSLRPSSSIVCKAHGSDNWPITWAEDDLLYTSYGDGYGFLPRTERKLSLGLATIAGTPASFEGTNLRSAGAERYGNGPRGPKASGMLSVDKTLYMWVRNVDNSQLAWSLDHGQSWEWGFRFTESFGHPTFMNAGKAYGDAPDDWVYTYSPDGPDAYTSFDGVVLARVHRASIRDREAYEFYAGAGSDGGPRWTDKIEQRVATFRYPRHCQRLDVVFHPRLQRYLMALAFDQEGGWGIFDAPQPWGPWTTAFFTPDGGLGRTHSYRLPSKWLDLHPGELTLVFSGREHEGMDYDAFCVRQAHILSR